MSKRKTDFKVPYKDGQLQQYAASGYGDPEYGWPGEEWRDNEPFHATLLILEMYSGRSAKGVWWIDGDGNRYPMFVSDLVDTLKIANVRNGEITGKWLVSKRGQNYGVRFFEE